MRAKSVFALFFLCMIPSLTLADDAGKSAAGAFATDLGHKALAVLSNAGESKEQKRTELETLFQRNVDITWIGQFVLGRSWRTATDDQKQRYLTNYKAFIIRHYTSNLSDYTDANFQVTRVTPEQNGGGYVVTMHIKQPQAEDIVVDYTIRPQQGDGLKVYDITVEGVSMITTQRSEFSSYVSQHGIDALIAELGRRSQQEETDGK